MAKKKQQRVSQKNSDDDVEPDNSPAPDVQENVGEKEDSDPSDEEILRIARERFDLAVEFETQIRIDELEDLKFRAGDQWPIDVKAGREVERRPCLTINKLPEYQRQVTNDQRQNRPSIKVSPVDDKATKETADVLQGLIRHIEYNSNADVAYDTAFEGGAGKGRGYFRVITDFCDPMSFDQDLLIKSIPNSFSVYLDPSRKEPDGSDSNWGFIFEDQNKDDYKAQHPKSKVSGMESWESIGDKPTTWATRGTVRVAEYFTKTFKQTTIVLLVDSQGNKKSIEKSKLPKELPEGVSVVAERNTVLPAIKWYKINGLEILERTDWLGIWIPIIPVQGDELNIDGKKIFEGIIRHAKDPQRMYNYWASAETETIALAPRAPYIGAAGAFEGFEEQWKNANTKSIPYLEYNLKNYQGMPCPPPTRNVYEPPVQAITQARMQASEDIKATTGIYDATMGARSNEHSGIAIQRRNQQSQTNNFHYIDNLSRSLKHLGRVLIDLIPKIYDAPRVARIIKEDGDQEIVKLNQMFNKDGKDIMYDLNAGKYDVTVATGPSYATKRQEAAASMIDLTKSYPQLMQVAGDLMVKNMDWPQSDEIAERMKKMLPPGIADDKKNQQPLPPQVQQQMTQMSGLIDNLTKELNTANDIIDKKVFEIQSRERIENRKIEADIEINLAKLGSQEAQTLLMHQVGEIENRLSLLQVNQPIQVPTQPINNGAAGPQATPPNDQQTTQPTGGQSPGQSMGV